LFFSTFNDLKQVEKIIGNIKDKRRIILSNMKSLGMVKGVLDFMFYYKGVLHVIDFKVGNDRLSPKQKTFIAQIESQGGKGYEVRTIEEFKSIIEKIIL
jgi:formylmethanofuran dehydrogenase subunit B